MTVGEFCNREVVVSTRSADIILLSQLMREHHVGDIVIVDATEEGQNMPAGIITDRDIVIELIACEVPLNTVKAEDVMSRDLVYVREEDGIWDALRLMQRKGVRRLIVVNGQGGLEGILTVDDLLELLAEELNSLSKIPFKGVSKEEETRRG